MNRESRFSCVTGHGIEFGGQGMIRETREGRRISDPLLNARLRCAVHPHAYRARRLSCSMTACSRLPLGEYPTVVTGRTNHATSVELCTTLLYASHRLEVGSRGRSSSDLTDSPSPAAVKSVRSPPLVRVAQPLSQERRQCRSAHTVSDSTGRAFFRSHDQGRLVFDFDHRHLRIPEGRREVRRELTDASGRLVVRDGEFPVPNGPFGAL